MEGAACARGVPSRQGGADGPESRGGMRPERPAGSVGTEVCSLGHVAIRLVFASITMWDGKAAGDLSSSPPESSTPLGGPTILPCLPCSLLSLRSSHCIGPDSSYLPYMGPRARL